MTWRLPLACLLAAPLAGPAADPPAARYDWTKETATGDVTKQLAGNVRGNVLDLGPGKIVLAPSMKLTKAVIDPVKLQLTITVAEPDQTARFEGLAGAAGGYQPAGAGPRAIRIDQPSHTEKFLRKGTLTLSVLKPAVKAAASGIPPAGRPDPGAYRPFPGQPGTPDPGRPAPAPAPLPDTPTRNKNHAEYVAGARQWTQNYTLGGTEVFVRPPDDALVNEQWKKEIEARKQRVKELDEVVERARRGEFTRQETVSYVDTDGRTRERTVTVDNNLTYGMLAMNARLTAQGASADALYSDLKRQQQIRFEVARQNYWRGVLPGGPAPFAGPVSKAPLLSYRYDPFYKTQADERYWAKHLLKNASGKTLHNVTLAADLFHFSTDDVPTTRHVYFVPVWKPGVELELSRWFIPESKPGVRYHVPKAGHVNDPPSPELDRIAGVVRMDVTLWADEARQEATPIRLPERAEKIAPELIKVAEDRILHPAWDFTGTAPRRSDSLPPALRPRTPAAPKAARPPAEQFAAEFLAPVLLPVVKNLPPRSEYVRTAVAYLSDPVAARATIQRAAGRGVVAMCQPKKAYESLFSERFAARKLGVVFLECDPDGKTVRAELYDPENPKLTRPVAGSVLTDQRTNEPFVFLAATAPATLPVPPARNVGFVTDANRRTDPFEPNCGSIALFLRDGALMADAGGRMTAAAAAGGRVFRPVVPLAAAKADDARFAAAIERLNQTQKAAPPKSGKP